MIKLQPGAAPVPAEPTVPQTFRGSTATPTQATEATLPTVATDSLHREGCYRELSQAMLGHIRVAHDQRLVPKMAQWAHQQWQRWTSPHAMRTLLPIASNALEVEARGHGPHTDYIELTPEEGAANEARAKALPFVPHAKVLAKLTSDLDEMRQSIVHALAPEANESAARQDYKKNALQHLTPHMKALQVTLDRLLNNSPRCTYGDSVAMMREYAFLADAEVLLAESLAGDPISCINMEEPFSKDQFNGSNGIIPRVTPNSSGLWLFDYEASSIYSAAPAMLVFPNFDACDRSDFTPLPVWPIELSRGRASFDNRASALPSLRIAHDMAHAASIPRTRLRERGGRADAGQYYRTPVERADVLTIMRRTSRELTAYEGWQTRIGTVSSPKLRMLLEVAVFHVSHESQRVLIRTKLSDALDRLPTQLHHLQGTGITSDELPTLIVEAKTWLMKSGWKRA